MRDVALIPVTQLYGPRYLPKGTFDRLESVE